MANAWGVAFGSAWGVSWGTDTPPTPDVTSKNDGGGFKGRVVYFNRPPELIPVKAKAKVLKRIAKRLKVTAQEAEYAYEWADSVTAGLVSLQHWRDLALDTSNRQLTQPEIRAVSAYWDAVFKASIEVAEDEDLALLLF